jgi:hypothetical protein
MLDEEIFEAITNYGIKNGNRPGDYDSTAL